MLRVGASDVFERAYTQKFREFAGQFGEFVAYERDRGARDIGLHLTQKLKSGSERVSTALCWFQLKGITKTTLPKSDFEKSRSVGLPLKVKHLQYWYLQPMPTYLALYIESGEVFLILNLQKYVADKWGQNIFVLKQSKVTVEIPTSSILDEQAFRIILSQSNITEWMKALGTDQQTTSLCDRDHELIWRVGTAAKRKVEIRVRIIDWQSKTRGEIHFEERQINEDKWSTIRTHWQFMLSAEAVEGTYPYLTFFATEDELEEDWFAAEDEDGYSERA